MKQPTVYEINTAVFLRELSEQLNRHVTLANVPAEIWDEIAYYGHDMVWLMGVWQRSPLARGIVLRENWLKDVLPDLQDNDVIGSAYSISHYVVDEALGGNAALAVAREQLKTRGIGLMLDYVPNHVAIDHLWASEHPEYLVQGVSSDLQAHPEGFVKTPGGIIAKGKDPNYAPWSDVLQINAFSLDLRQAVKTLLLEIATMCDALRCDMAMLLLNDIFAKTWGGRVGHIPETEYWPAIIQAVKKQYPEFIFLAEVYWGKEIDLIEQGFDYCYDKVLYDELIQGDVLNIKEHLRQPLALQNHLMRFLENHDEGRAAAVFSFEKHQAAAVITALTPGMHLFHDGQYEGRNIKVPVHLNRRPKEEISEVVQNFYTDLVSLAKTIDFEHDHWELLEAHTGFWRHESRHILTWAWHKQDSPSTVIALNYSSTASSARLPVLEDKRVEIVHAFDGEGVKVLRNATVMLRPWQVVVMQCDTSVREP